MKILGGTLSRDARDLAVWNSKRVPPRRFTKFCSLPLIPFQPVSFWLAKRVRESPPLPRILLFHFDPLPPLLTPLFFWLLFARLASSMPSTYQWFGPSRFLILRLLCSSFPLDNGRWNRDSASEAQSTMPYLQPPDIYVIFRQRTVLSLSLSFSLSRSFLLYMYVYTAW